MSEESLKFYYINVHLKLNSDLDETHLNEKLNLFRKIIPQESSVLDVMKHLS